MHLFSNYSRNFLVKEFLQKAAHKVLVNLAIGNDPASHRRSSSLFNRNCGLSLTSPTQGNMQTRGNSRKKILVRCQFHQHFAPIFWRQKYKSRNFRKLLNSLSYKKISLRNFRKLLNSLSYKKISLKMLMKLTPVYGFDMKMRRKFADHLFKVIQGKFRSYEKCFIPKKNNISWHKVKAR